MTELAPYTGAPIEQYQPGLAMTPDQFDIPDDPHERNIWYSDYLAAVSIVMAHKQARLEEVLARDFHETLRRTS